MSTSLTGEISQSRQTKKRRVINSCQYCRSKKLKCDKEKPLCSTCLRLNIKCIYFDSTRAEDILSMDEQIYNLEQQIDALKRQKDQLENTQKTVQLGRALSLFSLFKSDNFLNCMIRNTKKNVPQKIKNEFDREKNQNYSIDSIRLSMIQNNQRLYDLIKPYLKHPDTYELVHHFFHSELYTDFSFILKCEFMEKFNRLFKIIDYIFFGQLLMIMRISSSSYYNCGYSEVRHSYIINYEPVYLAKLCLQQTEKPLHNNTQEFIKLSLLIEFSQLYGPESVSFIDDLIALDASRLIRIASLSEYNTENSAITDSKRRIWHTLIELDNIKFIYDGTPLFIHQNFFSVALPKGVESDTELSFAITTHYQERSKIYPFIKSVSNLLNSVRNSPTVSSFEKKLDEIMDYCSLNNLDSIMNLDSETIEQRVIKSVKFINLLDLTSLIFTLSLHIFIKEDSKTTLRRVLKSVNCLLKLSYFLDSHHNHFYNLQRHFGFNFHLVPKILSCLHRIFQFHLSLLIRSHYFSLKTNNEVFIELKRISSANIKVLLGNFRKVSNYSVYGKRLYMMHSFMIITNFGTQLQQIRSPAMIQSLNDSKIELSNDTIAKHRLICEMLVELGGDEEAPSEFAYAENELENFMVNNGLDSSKIDQLEVLLDKQTFLI